MIKKNTSISTKKIFPELCKQMNQGNLTEYLKLLSDDVIIDFAGVMLADDVTEDILPIFEAVMTEIEYRNDFKNKKMLHQSSEIKEIYKKSIICLYNNCLTDYFKILSDEQLDMLEGYLVPDDIIGDRAVIYEVLKLEKEYRKSDRELICQRIIKLYKR